MKIGVFTVLFQQLPFEDMLDVVRAAGVDAVEIGTGNYFGNTHCKPDQLLSDDARLGGLGTHSRVWDCSSARSAATPIRCTRASR